MKLRNLIAGASALCGFAVSASAETVEYWDPVGKVTNSVEAVVVTGATTTLTGGWYVVTGEVSRAQINVTGTDETPANLILADGAKLPARDSSDYHPGIKVASGAAMNIYAQSVDADAMGQLSAHGGYGGAGIGGAGEGGTCGTVNIYGGKLMAVGGEYAAGIGGGGKASKTGGTGGTISIYGGIVTANGENGGAAIGGGNRADGGVISIYGGEVIADNTKGDSEGAGIGGGYAGAGGMILIAGGKVTAVGGYKDNGGAGIGGGEEGSGGTIMITGGIVNATGTDYGAGIGGGDEGAGGDVTISGGTVVAKAGKSSVWDIGSGSGGGFSGEFVVKGGSVLLANSGLCRDGYPKNGDGTQVYGVMIPGLEGKVTLEGLEGYGSNDIYTDVSGRICLYLPSGSFSFTLTDENGMYSVTVVDGQASVVPVRVRTSYWDPVSGVEKSEYCIVVDGSTVLKDGDWYVVTGKVARGSIAVSGNGNLILADGCELTANGGENQAGVAVPSGNSLTIYGQMAGTGELTATGGDKGAGIGGGLEGDGGTVTISGGRLRVVAGDGAAVIGAGYGGRLQGTVTILGGIFAWKPNDAWLVDKEVIHVVANPDAATCEKYPWAVDPTGASFVSFGKPLEHMTAAWTSGDGSVLKPIGREFFVVPKGATDVKVIFTPEERYELDKTEYAFAGPINEDCSIPTEDLPTAQLVLPEGYRRVEYIESTVGGGQYIDTGVKASSTLTATMDYMAFEHTGRVNLGTFAADNADWRYFDYSGGPLFDCGSARVGSTSGNTLDLNVRYVVNVGSEGDNICLAVTNAETKAEVKSFKAARSGAPSEENVFVFGGYSGDSLVCTSMRLYSLTLRDFANVGDVERTILAEFVPCVRASDGAVGLFDVEGGRFVENEGSGFFVAKGDLLVTVTVPSHAHVIASWTSGDGSVTNRIPGAVFQVLKDVPFKVLFTPEYNVYALEGPSVYESAGISADLALTDEQVPVARALPVEYVDADGSSKTCSDHDFVTDATSVLTSGWYAVAGEVSRGSIAVNGKVHLILLDGCELTAAGGDGQAGVFVDLGHSLTIYGQVNGTGKLIATGGMNGAGIGGQNPDGLEGYGGFGAITVNGGVVSSTSGSYGAGIGGGEWGAGGEVTINGGTVTATVSYGYGAGIGGGSDADGGIVTVTINGGTVTATAVNSGAGIGGGAWGSGGVVTINGGTVTATCLTYGGAGIGGGSNGGAGGKLTITGGVVMATGGDGGAGIGGGNGGEGGDITISGGTVTATSTGSGAGIGGGNKGAGGEVTISGGRLKVVAGSGAAVIGAGNWGGSQGTVSISGGIFSWKPLNGWMADQSLKPWWNLDSTTCATYPWAVLPVWNVGEDVTAYVGDNMTLVIGGTGAMDDFASAADAPWNELAGEMTKVEVGDGVTHIGKNAFVGLADAVTVNGVQMSDYRMMGGAYGMSAGQSPSGSIEIVDGKAYLEVAVKTNVNLTAEAKGWGKVGLEAKDVSVENGSVIIAVPANDEQGFMVLESGAAK